MNKVALYILLVFIYLGIDRALVKNNHSNTTLRNPSFYRLYFPETPITVILVGQYTQGFFIPTYFHVYKVIHPVRSPYYKTIKVGRFLFEKGSSYLGMSLFRRDDFQREETIPMPPGDLFIGNKTYGDWGISFTQNQRIWDFKPEYRHLRKELGLENFEITYQFFRRKKIHHEREIPFYGIKKEFGSKGVIKDLHLTARFYQKKKARSFKKIILQYFPKPFQGREVQIHE